MDTMETIMTRRSIRKFKDTPLSEEKIWKYLEAANMAPTASNRQPWNFIVIQREKLENLQELLEASFKERLEDMGEEDYQNYKERLEKMPIPGEADQIKNMQSFFRTLGNAPVAILVYVDEPDSEQQGFLDVQDAAAAIENLILAAWADGVGSCWMCGPLVKKGDALKKIFNITDKRLIALIPLGYPETFPVKTPPKDDVKDKTRGLP